MNDILTNRVAEASLLTLDLESFYPGAEVVAFDFRDYLFMGLILKEKDFRESLKNIDFQLFTGKIVAVHCSADAIIPMWAYMLVASYLQPVAKEIYSGTIDFAIEESMVNAIRKVDKIAFTNQRVVVKGCGDKNIGERVYLEITRELREVAKSIMYGEPCSTVPVFKRAALKQ